MANLFPQECSVGVGLARCSPQLLPSSFSSGLTRYSVAHLVQLPCCSGAGRQTWWMRAAVSHPTPVPGTLFCSSWNGGLFEGRRWKEAKSAHDGLGGHMEEGAWLANVDLAKCSYHHCPMVLPRAEAEAAQELSCSCGLPHSHPYVLSSGSSYLTTAQPFTLYSPRPGSRPDAVSL